MQGPLRHGHELCGTAGSRPVANPQSRRADLSKPIDVYSDWVDAAVEQTAAGGAGARGAAGAARHTGGAGYGAAAAAGGGNADGRGGYGAAPAARTGGRGGDAEFDISDNDEDLVEGYYAAH